MITWEQVLYMGWYLFHSEDEIHVTRSPLNANWTPIQAQSLAQSRINLIRSLSIRANAVPIGCQSDASPRSTFRFIINSPISKNGQYSRSTTIFQSANPGQSMPSWDNQMSIPDHSHANPGPIRFQSGANQMPIQGHSLDQSRII